MVAVAVEVVVAVVAVVVAAVAVVAAAMAVAVAAAVQSPASSCQYLSCCFLIEVPFLSEAVCADGAARCRLVRDMDYCQ